ncbi:site-2 protease family protein [Candidatus Dojkabacteria bacterium]|nr:site-2 protease family protein [Candidatus Dojkabacteria bacterium]
MAIVWFIVIVSVLIVAHELGHFLFARLFKIRVEQFAIGFGPKLWSKKFGETEFMLNLIPLGGYVSIYGQDEPQKGKDSFSAKPVWQRFLVVAGGAIFNFLLTGLLFYIVLFRSGFSESFDFSFLGTEKGFLFGTQEITSERGLVYSGLTEEYPAEAVGMIDQGIVVSIDGITFNNGDELAEYVNARPNQMVSVKVSDFDGNESEYELTISNDGYMGVQLLGVSLIKVSYNGLDRIFSGFLHGANYLSYQLRMLSRIITFAVESKQLNILSDVFTGPVAVYQTVEQVSKQQDVIEIVKLAAFISLNLFFVNLLPLPALDGGYLLLYVIEAVFKKKLPYKTQQTIMAIGFIILMIVSGLFIINDIIRFSQRQQMFEIEAEL